MPQPQPKPKVAAPAAPNAAMSMSIDARVRMRATEKEVYNYYNDMGKNKGNCTWGAGILAHKGVCSAEELGRRVKAPLNQAQFDALCSLTFNAGSTGADDTFELLNNNDFAGAAANIDKMIKVTVIKNGKKKKVVARGLIKRRAEESAPFRVKAASQPAQ
jgi:lysozyme